MKRLKTILGLVCLQIATMSAIAAPILQTAKQPIYTITINVVDRSTKAINYQHRNGSTTIDFKGTPLMAASRGEAKVESKQGYMEVEVEFDNLQPATRFGPELLTYVLWAISPDNVRKPPLSIFGVDAHPWRNQAEFRRAGVLI